MHQSLLTFWERTYGYNKSLWTKAQARCINRSMGTQGNPIGFTPPQIQAIKFLGANKIDTTGKKWTIEDFSRQVLKINPCTFYDWQSKPAFRQAVLEETMGRVTQFVPAMVQAQVAKAVKKQDTPAFMAIMRQAGVLKADRTDSTVEHTGEVAFTNNVPLTG